MFNLKKNNEKFYVTFIDKFCKKKNKIKFKKMKVYILDSIPWPKIHRVCLFENHVFCFFRQI